MITARADEDNVPQCESFRSKAVELPSLDDPSTELVLLTVTPDVDGSIGGERDDVVGSAGDGRETKVRNGREGDRGELEFWRARFTVEAEETFSGLCARKEKNI